MGERYLGMRFTFRDTIGLGTNINDDWKVSLSFIHYSHLCECINQGINAHVELGGYLYFLIFSLIV
ncbi:acyloxyacyl hydrolase [Paraphotobacterium marinum]|uniref:acyloxyacyl hydrolase n=1 Tax=Paraphotobacterium marinum TaxID=1755811 RepID=UPI001CEF9708